MSPPDTNLKKQESRHKWPLIGMAIVVIFGIGIIVFWTGEEVATAPGTEDEVIVDDGTGIEGDDTATVPVAPD
ncbi:hypothetical protein DSM110093_02297 [Sulfitobacter sp. DSM 110093]|uniref:hypothetical protein n=1 Tax=Sulfitobacter sp. DSM 110093 TaxID=2883127 RepID=UPI001FADDA41|nr:hypothetical protein [Sulfitobacter sp. DSM 110093]UOA32497.1 hypothetical protein DSM110093_02297 [Sulfitobacter sp. DSM 110093]